ncbi:MAG: TIGR03016 family PEP-CTERM system-associated outer membrane protein [Rhodanobacteraceae bacterium]
MRASSASVVLSSIILGGWLTGAKAQNVGSDTPSTLSSASNEQTVSAENLAPGVIPQPTIDSPGMVTGVTLGELYTDNLTLAASGKPKQASWITQIQPFFKSAFSSPRLSGVFDYTLTGYLYPGKSSDNQLTQDLDAYGTLTVVPQHFFVDGTALYGDAVINNELPAGGGTFFLDNNRANVGRVTLSPYWIQGLGNVGTMLLRYTFGRVMYNDRGIPTENDTLLTGIPNVTSNAVQFSLASPKYQTWGWNLQYVDQRLTPDFGQDVEFATARLGASRQINTDTKLLVDVGKETNFLPDGTVQTWGASFWDAGFDWSNTRDHFRLLVGHRFFGHSYQLTWTHQAALLTTNLSYVEQPTTYNQQLLGQNPGEIITPPIGIPQIPSLTERQVYLMKRAMATATYTMARSRLSVTLYDEQRTYFVLNNNQERVANADINWLFNIGAFTTLTPTFGWQRYQFGNGQIRYNNYEQLALVHQLNPKNFGSVRLRHDSSSVYAVLPGSHGYGVNVIFLQWTHLL